MILLCGIPSETPLAMVQRELADLGAPALVFNQRRFSTAHLTFEIVSGRIDGELTVDERRVPVGEVSGVYTRLMDEQSLPEFRALPIEGGERDRCRDLHDALIRWLEIAPARVVNRCRPMASNISKPYQAQLISRHGFAIPETLITNDPECVRSFHARHGRVIYKSISGVRSIVQELVAEDLSRLDSIRWCPTQFQELVGGTNIRVHVVGQEVFATRIDSDIVDYRYAARQGGEARLSPVELCDDQAERCVRLAAALELPFAGIDLKVSNGEVFCFEVNPSPGFSYFEQATGQPIARALARYLLGVAS